MFLQNQFGRTALSEAESNAPESLTLLRGGSGNAGQQQQEKKENGSSNTGSGGQDDEKMVVSKHMECAGYLLGFMELEAEKKQGSSDQQSRTRNGGDEDGEDVTLGVAKMGVAASNGEFEFVEGKQ